MEGKAVLGEALLDAYEDLFHVNANPSDKDKQAIIGKFKSTHNATDRVAEQQASTFFALLKLADIEAGRNRKGVLSQIIPRIDENSPEKDEGKFGREGSARAPLNLRYQIEVHLPATKDIEVYHAIFRSIRENLLD
jgi:hypothetical protein